MEDEDTKGYDKAYCAGQQTVFQNSTRTMGFTGIAANLVGRRYLGIEREKEFVEISQKRREEIEDLKVYSQFRKKIKDIAKSETLMPNLFTCEEEPIMDLPFLSAAAKFSPI